MIRKSIKHRAGLLHVLAVSAVLFAFGTMDAQDGHAAAPEKPAESKVEAASAWAVRCHEPKPAEKEAQKNSAASKQCEVFQRQDVKKTGQRVIEMAIGYPPERKDARGVFILPTGILLQDGVTLKIDDNDPLKFQVRYCVPNGCMAYVTMSNAILETMSKGNTAFVGITQINGAKVSIPMPLKGFNDALAKIK